MADAKTTSWPPEASGQGHFAGHGRFPMPAYSEFMPPPRLGVNPYSGEIDASLFGERPEDKSWRISELEELTELRPGLERAAKTVAEAIGAAISGRPWKGLGKAELEDNPYWPGQPLSNADELSILLPLALSKTQDDKGRVRWTLFGGSHFGPERAFWESFEGADGVEFLKRFAGLSLNGGTPLEGSLKDAGLRILASEAKPGPNAWAGHPLPEWAAELSLNDSELDSGLVKTVFTFQAYEYMPEKLKAAALAGRVKLLPSPETLAVWSRKLSGRLERGLSRAAQIPLLLLFRRYEGEGLRVPQSGSMHEGRREEEIDRLTAGRTSYRRSSRQDKHARHMDILQFEGRETRMAKALFSSEPEDTGLYDKPLARNCQLWSANFLPVLDGPNAAEGELLDVASTVLRGGSFGYRMLFPPTRAGDCEVFWHRPLAAVASKRFGTLRVMLDDAPLGMMTAESSKGETRLRPEILKRAERREAIELAAAPHCKAGSKELSCDLLRVFEAAEALGPLPEDVAAKIALLPGDSIKPLLAKIERTAKSPGQAELLREALRKTASEAKRPLPEALSFHRTATRDFELAYWNAIRRMSSGEFVNKNNADCVHDGPSSMLRTKHERGLDLLGDYLLERHSRIVKESGVEGAFAGSVPFSWGGEFRFDWQGGWHDNRLGRRVERDLITVIPGKDRSRAIVLADHYDTAFMEDVFADSYGARLAAAGADDNLSATATLLLGAPIFLELAKAGKLGCDVWLVHLTGEEFPSDCMGARRLAQLLVERRLAAKLPGGERVDLSKATVEAFYVMDMIAHNNEAEPDVFQISPGAWPSALKAALHLHDARTLWNSMKADFDAREKRLGLPRGKRSKNADAPSAAPFLKLDGQIRLHNSRRSSLYNTDGQVLSDAGLPAVLVMENYDISRKGYHDTQDTMENIDLDYGSAIAAICIEAAAQAANA